MVRAPANDAVSADAAPAASIVITTRNRCARLRRAIASSVAQTADVEVLVIDDASTDGTAEMIRSEFPEVRLFRDEQARGYIARRNRGVRMARAPIVVSIDDDAHFPSPRTVEQTLADFDDDRVGAVAIPYVDLIPRRIAYQVPPDHHSVWAVHRYIGTAHAIRRDLFLDLGGYRVAFVSRCEEADLCVRILDAGRVTRLGSADVIHHAAGPRDAGQNMRMQARNDLLHAWANVPLRFLPVRLVQATAWHVYVGIILRHPFAVAAGIVSGYAAMATRTVLRRPVAIRTHRIDMQLRRRGPIRLAELVDRLPEPAPYRGEARAT